MPDNTTFSGMIQPTNIDGLPDTHYTTSPTTMSFVPSETATLSGNGGSTFSTGKGPNLNGLPESGPLPPTAPLAGERVQPPNITVPQNQTNRTLVLCFDGTGDQFDNDNSNIVELFGILKKDDPEKQMVYYQAGIGTYTVPQIATPFMASVSKTLDEMIAWNLDAHIMGGYEFLMQNYKAGDKICIFGFSRGAYTARCLAGMIHKVGLLPSWNHQQVPFAYKMYTRNDPLGWKQSNAFKATFSSHVPIAFLGVWDTVNSVGLIPRRLPFTTSNCSVRVFRHAISLDERRSKFKQNTWNHPTPEESLLAASDRVQAANEDANASVEHPHHPHVNDREKKKKKPSQKQLEREYSDVYEGPTNIEEVWFAGCHTDVGGGSVINGMRPNLARIPLRWMIREMFATNTGILVHARGLRRLGLDLDPVTWCPILERSPPLKVPEGTVIREPETQAKVTELEHENLIKVWAAEEHHLSEREIDIRDALSPIYDQLSLAPFWWILEVLPVKHRYQKDDNSWTSYLGINLGRGRHIPKQKKQKVKVHSSVKIRMEAEHANGKKYTPKADLDMEHVDWID